MYIRRSWVVLGTVDADGLLQGVFLLVPPNKILVLKMTKSLPKKWKQTCHKEMWSSYFWAFTFLAGILPSSTLRTFRGWTSKKTPCVYNKLVAKSWPLTTVEKKRQTTVLFQRESSQVDKPGRVSWGRIGTGWLSSYRLIEVVHNLGIKWDQEKNENMMRPRKRMRIWWGQGKEAKVGTLRKKSHTERFFPNKRADLNPKLNTCTSTS